MECRPNFEEIWNKDNICNREHKKTFDFHFLGNRKTIKKGNKWEGLIFGGQE